MKINTNNDNYDTIHILNRRAHQPGVDATAPLAVR